MGRKVLAVALAFAPPVVYIAAHDIPSAWRDNGLPEVF